MPISLSTLIDLCESQAPLAIAVLDADLRCQYVSARWLDDYGLDRSAVLGRDYRELFPRLPQAWNGAFQRVLAADTEEAGETERCSTYVWRHVDGTTRCSDWELKQWRGRLPESSEIAGEPAPDLEARGVVIFSESAVQTAERFRLSELMQQREALLQTERKQRRRLEALRQSALAISALDANLAEHAVDLLQLILDQARALTGADYGALGVGTDPTRSFDPWVVSGLTQSQIDLIGRTPKPVGLLAQIACEHRAIRLDDIAAVVPGVVFPPHHPQLGPLLGVPIMSRGVVLGNLYLARQPGAAAFVHEDQAILELLAGHAAIAIENAKLFSKAFADVRAREEVLAVVSHDLTNPLNAIALREQQLSRLEDPKVSSHAHSVTRSVDEMRRMIRGLLDVTRLDSGRLVLETQPTDVSALISDLVDGMTPLASDREVAIRVEVQVAQPVVLDRERIWQVLANLVGNALKFTPSGGEVSVQVHQEGQDLAIIVTDTGVGIGAEELPHVFDRYFTNSKGHRGTGLGLYIAKGLVEAHGGKIWIDSTLGKGTVAQIRLPMGAQDEVHDTASVR